MEANDELEIGFYSVLESNKSIHLNMENFRTMLNNIKALSKENKEYKLENNATLDVIYNPSEKGETSVRGKTSVKGGAYRITIEGQEDINKYTRISFNRRNHMIYKILLSRIKKVIRKKRESFTIIDDYDMKVRLSHEENLDKKAIKTLFDTVDETQRNNILYRHKHRVSLILLDDENFTIRIDLTTTKTHRNLRKLEFSRPAYELELELFKKTEGKNKTSYIETYIKEATQILKILQQSSYLITKKETRDVLNFYCELLKLNCTNIINLDVRQSISLEIQHVLENLPNKYCVTDKADGERYFLIIYKKKVYLISNNLAVKSAGIEIGNKEYNGTILDGEYIFHAESNRYMFMAFDILFHKGKDVRDMSPVSKRLELVTEVIKECFTLSGMMEHNFSSSDSIDSKEVIEYYKKDITAYLKVLNYNLKLESNHILVQRKYFIFPIGSQDNEIFKYAKLIWDLYVQKGLCPYNLDGLIFTPIETKYLISMESRLLELKWKQPDKNSIDFYIQFVRDRDTGQVMTLFDNRSTELLRGKTYQIAYLHVGKFFGKEEKPILFQRKENKYMAYLFLQNGQVRDLSGEIIQDSTVVEFYYNNDPNLDERFRWVPIRTRYDKTESVMRFGRKYGNGANVANKIWRSISNPFTMDDIITLSSDANYTQNSKRLRERVSHNIISLERKENVYFQIESDLAEPMRNFHNWVKSIIIYTYCSPRYDTLQNIRVFDIGIGRGQDIMKFYYSRIDFLIGIDIDIEALNSAVNGAVSRYRQMRKVHKNFAKMFFIQADAGSLLTVADQSKAIINMDDKNKHLIQQFLDPPNGKNMDFDRITCQFAIHYFFADNTIWSNFCQNINKILRPGGYMIITTFDAEKVMKVLETSDKYTSYYTDDKGVKKILFDIVKKYDITSDEKKNGVGTGKAIDFHIATFMYENNYATEYLVDRRFLEKEFQEKCNMRLVESDSFTSLYHTNREYFEKVAKFDTNIKTRNYLLKTATYYDNTQSINKAGYKLTELYRYYVFQKAEDEKYVPEARRVISKKPIFKQKSEQIGGNFYFPNYGYYPNQEYFNQNNYTEYEGFDTTGSFYNRGIEEVVNI
jgi:SAM-dependent methyltransferase